MSKKQTKTKETKDLVEIDPIDTVNAILDNSKTSKKDKKQLKFHMLRFFGLPIKSCAKLAGYTHTYGNKLDQ